VVLGTEKGNKLGYFFVAESVAEWRHLLSSVEDLVGHLIGRPSLVVANLGKSGSLLGALEGWAVAESATFITIEGGAGFYVGRGVCGECGGGGEDQESGKESKTQKHESIFACGAAGPSPTKG
jgi:hypothetical protein